MTRVLSLIDLIVVSEKLLGMILRAGVLPVPGTGRNLLTATEADAKKDFKAAF